MPWVADGKGPPSGVAICLSGGGLRSAAFSLGALQALQGSKKLLFGPESADLLVAVSGGSYTAAAHALTASSLAESDSLPPLALESPEAKWIGQHSQYVLGGGPMRATWRLVVKFLVPGLINVAGFAALFVWLGFMMADFEWILTDVFDLGEYYPLVGTSTAGVLIDTSIGLGLATWGLRAWYSDGLYKTLGATAILITVAFVPSMMDAMRLTPFLSDPQAWKGWVPGLVVAGITCVILLGAFFGPRIPSSLLRSFVVVPSAILAPMIPRLAGAVALSLVATSLAVFIASSFQTATPAEYVSLAMILIAPLVLAWLAGRVSLHRSYRSLLSSCFGVRRVGATVESVSSRAPFSQCAPSVERSPKLLIAATANVRLRRGGRTVGHHPFVLSDDFSGIPGRPNGFLPTKQLELARSPGGDRQVSLFSAVAATGAALSPSMGRFTKGTLRPFLAAFNVRLGRWMTNPECKPAVARLLRLKAPGWVTGQRLVRALDEMLQEAYGLHSPRQALVYVSDGGHYDNLGLIVALHGRPSEVWCIDASPDRRGFAAELRRDIEIAPAELSGVTIDVPDIDSFKALDGYHEAICAKGTITFADGATTALYVVRLGLTKGSSDDLKGYRRIDRRFPYQATPNQNYPPERFEAYRRMGFENVRESLTRFE